MRTGRGTILVVEDDDDVRKFTAEVLGGLGYRVLTARDAASALRALEGEVDGVDLLFTDHGRLDPDVELIVKPFSQGSLSEAVEKVLNVRRESV